MRRAPRALPRLPAARPSRAPARCPACGSPRLLAHPERDALAIAHVDCDAFFAAVEKRDDPSLHDRPVIVGGGRRGVVATACYVARTYGVRSAMPMFKALKACPDAVVIRPDIDKYRRVGREVRAPDAGADPAGRAGLDRRGLPRPLRHRAPAPCEPGRDARALRAGGSRTRSASRSRSGCRTTSSWRRSPPTSTSRAASRSSAGPRPRRGSPICPSPSCRASARRRRRGWRSSASPICATCAARRSRDLTRLLGREAAELVRFSNGEDARPVRPERGDEERLGRDHLRHRPARLRGAASRSCGVCASGCRGG